MNHADIANSLLEDMVVLDHEPFKDKEDMFDFMTQKFEDCNIVSDAKIFKEALEERESQGPTYMGNMIAIPHGKCKEVLEPGIGFCRCKEPFIYESCGESGEVKYIFVLAISDHQANDYHLRVLSTLAGMLAHDEFWEVLKRVNTFKELQEGIKDL
ncbi:MAG: PTS sugar transporter subunit IIA [Anaerostipes sp.]|nr:PTS sugar transporter subunit IIA [Anaerostipes sp.]